MRYRAVLGQALREPISWTSTLAYLVGRRA